VRLLRSLCALIAVSLATASAAAASPAGVATPGPVVDDLVLGRSVAAAINATRMERGLPSLRAWGALARAARSHAHSLAALGTFTHSPIRTVAASYAKGTQRWAVGEIMLWVVGTLSAREAVDRWLASEPHRRDLLGRWGHLGVGAIHAANAPGIYRGRNVTIVVVDFGRRS
jgi:uncharacterized protein YkwD